MSMLQRLREPDAELVELVRRWGWKLLALATSTVIVLSAVRGLRFGYQPAGDNALIELRGRDVLTGHHPWLGTWSSVSNSAGLDINHPGPLIFDLVALPVRLFGGPVGIAVAVVTFNIVVVWSVGLVAVRVGGATAAIVAQAVTAGLCWTLGSELLYDPWQPNLLVLPFWLLVLMVWAMAADVVVVAPFAVAVASFAMQTHIGYLFFAPLLLAFALVAMVARRLRRGPGRFDDLRRPLGLAAVVGLVLWAQPLVEQFFGPGKGNLSRIASAGTGSGGDGATGERAGVAGAVRMFSSVVTEPPWWTRSGFDVRRVGETSTESALAWLLVGVALVAAGWWTARRHGARRLVAGYWVLAVCSGAAFGTIAVTPIDGFGPSVHKFRYLWVIGAFATFLLTMSVLTALRDRQRRPAVGAVAFVSVLATVATVPVHVAIAGPVSARVTYEALGELRDQVATWVATEPDAPERVLFDPHGVGFAEPYTAPVIAELLHRGVEVVVTGAGDIRQLGNRRAAGADDAGLPVMFVRVGADAVVRLPGIERVAFHDGELSGFDDNNIRDRAVAVFVSADGVIP